MELNAKVYQKGASEFEFRVMLVFLKKLSLYDILHSMNTRIQTIRQYRRPAFGTRRYFREKTLCIKHPPSFVEGMASLLDMDIVSKRYRGYLEDNDADIDSESLFRDWSSVGDHFEESMIQEWKQYEQKTTKK
jgi:hypothetical protein